MTVRPTPGHIEKQRAQLPATAPVEVMIDVGESGGTALDKTMLAIVEPRLENLEMNFNFSWQDPEHKIGAGGMR